MGKTNILTPMWLNCRALLEKEDLEQADDELMRLIYKLADYTINGYKDADKIEGVKLETWKERAWYALENAGLLPE